ncbi:SNase-domain-containing protein [Agrocybe pediades]|nr:SNase-domain-containing protein [Agrocybe pediades]
MSSIPWPLWTNSEDKRQGKLREQYDALPPSVAALVFFSLGSVSALSAALVYRRYGRRVRNSDWVTPRLLTRKRWLKGVVTSVGDADNFRFFHTPTLAGYTWPIKFRSIPSITKELKDETIHIRIAGVDAPESSHFGKQAQPYAAESLEWLRNKVLGQTVYCQLLRKDQYSRVVAQVQLPPRVLPGFLFNGTSLPAEMLKAGVATVYEQAGAEYGRLGKEGYLKLEAEARAAKRGLWGFTKNPESPAEYKRRHAAASSAEGGTTSAARGNTKVLKTKGWLGRLLSRS